MNKGHEKLIRDLKILLKLAENFEYHDFKNNMFPAPKSALIRNLSMLVEETKKGTYDN